MFVVSSPFEFLVVCSSSCFLFIAKMWTGSQFYGTRSGLMGEMLCMNRSLADVASIMSTDTLIAIANQILFILSRQSAGVEQWVSLSLMVAFVLFEVLGAYSVSFGSAIHCQ